MTGIETATRRKNREEALSRAEQMESKYGTHQDTHSGPDHGEGRTRHPECGAVGLVSCRTGTICEQAL